MARNQTPIISPTIRGGASLVTALMPTGYRQISPNSEIAYEITIHQGLTRTPSAVACAIAPAGTSTRYDIPMKNSPSANLPLIDGCFAPSAVQVHAKSGV